MIEPTTHETVLEIRNLEKSFGALKATDGLSLDLRAGEIHALIGPNGAGKSTLIGQIAGFIKPDGGTINLMGHDISTLSVAKRAQLGLGRSFQVSSLAMPLSVRRNVAMAVQSRLGSSFGFWWPVRWTPAIGREVTEVLDRVGLADRAKVAVEELSHGERRQVEVACALALKPKVLLLDEPMAGLGQDGSKRMTKFLEDLKAEIPILLIEHDMDAVFALADRISVLVYGKVIASGNEIDIKANPLVREAYLGEET